MNIAAEKVKQNLIEVFKLLPQLDELTVESIAQAITIEVQNMDRNLIEQMTIKIFPIIERLIQTADISTSSKMFFIGALELIKKYI
jgi:hypothetical protein